MNHSYDRKLHEIFNSFLREHSPPNDLNRPKDLTAKPLVIKYYLKQLGIDLDNLDAEVVHIAGTSGKGSTTIMTSEILAGHKLKVGRITSPYVQSIQERFEILNDDMSDVVDVAENFKRQIDSDIPKSDLGELGYISALILFGIFYLISKGVDVLVVETGIGGLYDFTNVFNTKPKICLISDIGYDHTDLLGEDIQDIAHHKAGIISCNDKVFKIKQEEKVNNVFKQVAFAQSVDLEILNPDMSFELPKIKGVHQRRNLALAVSASKQILKSDYSETKTQSILNTLRLKARVDEYRLDDKWIIVDGAHNPQKISALGSYVSNHKVSFDTAIFTVFKYERINEIHTALKNFFKEVYFIDLEEITSISPVLSQKELPHDLIQINRGELQDLISSDKNIVFTGSMYICGFAYDNVIK